MQQFEARSAEQRPNSGAAAGANRAAVAPSAVPFRLRLARLSAEPLGVAMTISRSTSLLPREGTHLVLMGGLPGSGKTHYARQLEQLGWIFYDDFQAGAAGDSPRFRASRHYADLVSKLHDRRRCVVSDIRVVHDEYRTDAETAIRQDLGSVPVELHLFENDPKQCAKNVLNACDGRQAEARLEAIEFWTNRYSAPPDAVLHGVWRPPGGNSEPLES